MEYHVTWAIDLDADSPQAAARLALNIHRDPTSIATVFIVSAGDGTWVEVDLLEGTVEGVVQPDLFG